MEADSSAGTQGLTRALVGSSPESVSVGSAPPPALGPQAEQLITRGLGPSHQKASASTAPPKDPAPPAGPARGPSHSTASCIRTQPHRQHLVTSTRAGPGSRGGQGPAVQQCAHRSQPRLHEGTHTRASGPAGARSSGVGGLSAAGASGRLQDWEE